MRIVADQHLQFLVIIVLLWNLNFCIFISNTYILLHDTLTLRRVIDMICLLYDISKAFDSKNEINIISAIGNTYF